MIRVAIDGSKQTELFNDSDASLGWAAVCGEGQTIVAGMMSREGGNHVNLWRMDSDGANLKRLTRGETEGLPVCAPSGKQLYYFDAKNHKCLRLSLEGGSPETLPFAGVPGSGASAIQAISRDGRMLAAYGSIVDPATNTYKSKFAIVDSSTIKSPELLLDSDPRVSGMVWPQFSPDGKALAYVIRADNNVDNLWLQPLAGKPGRQMTTFKSDQIYRFSWSPDGKRILVGRGHFESDVVLLRDTTK
jgi:Tol biopolymer transport system component